MRRTPTSVASTNFATPACFLFNELAGKCKKIAAKHPSRFAILVHSPFCSTMLIGGDEMALELSGYLKEQALDPKWHEAGKVHDWRNHVGERTKEIWNTLTDAQKLAIAADANESASYEEWD
jgi:hypothetical protein